MHIRDYRGLQIQIHGKGKGFYAEIYRKDKLVHTVQGPGGPGGLFGSAPPAFEAAKGWIDKTYPPGRARYLGEVD